MDPLSVAASIIAVLQVANAIVSVCYDYSAAVKGPSWELTRVIEEVQSLRNVLEFLAALAKRAETADPSAGSRLPTLKLLCQPGTGPLAVCRAELQALEKKLQPPKWLGPGRPKMVAFSQALNWPLKKGETKKMLQNLERYKTTLSLAINVDQATMTLEVQEMVQAVQKTTLGLQEDVAGLYGSRSATKIDSKVSRWLSAPDPSSSHNEACSKRQATTGEWFVQSDYFAAWRTNANTLLWLHGIPGSGKTVLSSTIIENVLDYCRHVPKTVTAYFYFEFSSTEKQRDQMLRSLIAQLAAKRPNSPTPLDQLFSSSGDGASQPKIKCLVKTLQDLIKTFDMTFIILDALDECEERRELLNDIQTLAELGLEELHMLVTSRREEDIRQRLESLVCEEHNINIESEVVDEDIRVYIREVLQNDWDLRRWQKRPEIQAEIENALTENANGMFRWAVCQIDELKKCLNLTMLRQQLRSLPTSLDQTYERILLNIDKTYSNYALRMRCWLTYSARPLRLLELAEIFPIDVEEDPGFDPERRFPEPEDILLTCSSLVTVTVDAEEVYVLESEIDGEIKLAHFPVKEYLISNRIQESKASKYSLHETYANLSIAKDCLLYLLYISERVPETSRNTLEFPLASYAARNWAEHTRVKEIENSSIIIDLIIKLFESDGKTYANWLYSYDGGPGLQNPQLNHPSLFGILGPAPTKRPLYHDHEYLIDLLEPSRRLIDRCAEIDARQWYYGATLRVASANGRTEIVRLLLEAGAEPNFVIGDRVHDGALFAASSCGYHMIVRLLLDAGAEIRHGPSPGYYSPLHAAAHNGHHSVVAVLIGAGVDVNLNAGMWKGNADTALNLASQRGFDDVVELLITAGADVNIERGLKNSSLAEASFWGHNSTVKILLDAGAEVNMDGENCEQALMVASEQGHVGVVKQLLKVGADLETFSTSALFLAAANGKADVVSVLLDAGADPDSMGYTLNERKKPGALYEASGGGYQRIVDTRIYSKYRGTALQATSVSGQTKIVRLLLEANVDVNAKDTEGEASLQTAVNGKQIQVVEQLLSAGADVNATGGSCGGALAAALNIGQDEIAELLIKLGANANGQVPYYGSVLQSAAAKGKEGVVSQLLGAGADINMQGGRYGCALHAASACGHGKVVERLLQAGAPVNIQRRDGSPLQLAAREGHDMVIKLLLQHGTDVEMEGGNHDRPLFEAAKNGHLSTVRLLLDGGANVNAECGSLRGSVCAAAASSHKKSFEIVHLLLDAGADPKRQCEALGEAARRGDDEVVKLLLGAGVDPNSESEWVNPLQDAATWGQVSTLKILLEAGADVKRGDGFQYLGSKLSPLFWSPNRHETLTLLLEAGAEIKGSREGTLDDDDDDDWGPWNRI